MYMEQDTNNVSQIDTILPGPDVGEIVVNEVDPKNKKIEFYNTTDHDISLVGCVWKGTDENEAARDDYTITEKNIIATISSGGYGVWTFNSSDPTLGPAYGLSKSKHWAFELFNQDGTSILTINNTFEIDGASYITDKTGVNVIDCGSSYSFGRYPDGSENWRMFQVPTIGATNEIITPVEPDYVTTALTLKTEYTSPDVNYLSGLTFGKDKSLLYGVGDNGNIYTISFIDGSTYTTVNTRTFGGVNDDASAGETLESGKIGDFEAITYNVNDDMFYILNERPCIIYTYDLSSNSLEKTAVFEDGDNIGTTKNGFEGLTYNTREKFFIGHQDTAGLYEFNLSDSTPQLASITTLAEYVSEIADLSFDGTYIYVLDSKECSIVKCDSTGKVISKYSLPFLTSTDNPEALVIDPDTKIAYIGCDNDTSNSSNVLYKILLYDTTDVKTVVMNEFYPKKNEKKLELYNTTDQEIDLSGYTLYKDDKLDEPFVFNSSNLNTKIKAKSRLVIPIKADGIIGPEFGLSDEGFDYKLIDPSGVLVDHVDNLTNITVIPSGMSYGRKEDGSDEFVIFSTPSLGESNANGVIYDSGASEDIEPGEEITDHIVINECGVGKQIELYNPTSENIVLDGNYALIKVNENGEYDETYIDDDGITEKKGFWVFKNGNTINSKDRFVVSAGSGNVEIGPLFGLNISKKFKLFLYNVTSSTDYSTLDTINSTAILIDEFNNYDNQSNITGGLKNTDSIGRVNDATINFCCFRGGTIGKSNNDGIKYAWNTSTPDVPTGSKEVAYWVKDDEEYIYYPIFYDNDSILSLNNTGYSIYAPNVESTDTVGSGYAFNGAESVLWLNLKDAYANRIAEIYAEMRKNGLTYTDSLHFFTDTQSDMWSEAIYNMDAKFKYIEPATIGYTNFSKQDNTGAYGVNVTDSTYLFDCQGSRESHRSWWLNNRFNYMDSRYNTGNYLDSYALLRLYTPTEGTYNPIVKPNSTFKLTPYTDMYLRVKFGSIDGVVRAEKNKTYEVSSGTKDNYNDTETMVYGAQYLLSMGDLSDKYTKLINVTTASRINDLVLGHDAPYYNDNLTNLSFSSDNTALRKIDVRNCRQLSVMDGLNNLTSLETLLATNTSMSTFALPTTGCNLRTIEYPKALTILKLVDMQYISTSGIKFESYSNIESVWIEKCPLLDTWLIINNILMSKDNKLNNVRISDIKWNITTTQEFKLWQKILLMKGMNASGTQGSYKYPYLSGIVNISSNISISTGYKENVMKNINDITGATLTITGGHEEQMNGLNIIGETNITPNVWYTYNVSYLPDDYIIDSERGVTWELPDELEKRNETSESVEVRFAGSSSGNEKFIVKAISNFNNDYTGTLTITPGATLSNIVLYDISGNQINEISVYEGEQVNIQVEFVPENTTDTGIDISIDKPGLFEYYGGKPYEYSENTNQITLDAKEVSNRQTAIMSISSKTVDIPPTTLSVNVLNVVSRIIKLEDATSGSGTPITGYARIYIDGDNNGPYTINSDANGEIKIQTNKDYETTIGSGETTQTIKFRPGFNKLICECHADNENKAGYLYNKPENIVFAEIPETTQADIISTVSFYKPVKTNISIKNGGSLITDSNLLIYSRENYTIRPGVMNKTPYNNVIMNGENPVTMYLLANTTHNITITQVDENGEEVTNKKYSNFGGIIVTGSGEDEQNVEMNISRDYLGETTKYDESEVHLTVVTGDGDYTTVRLYYENESPIYIDWGDKDEQPNAYFNVITDNHVTTTSSTGVKVSGETVIYHTYLSNNREYEIAIRSNGTYNTKGVKWFHVIPQGSSKMIPCIGTGNTSAGFSSTFDKGRGGLVAYQFIGQAKMNEPLRFNMPSENDKQYSKLITIGDIYRNNKDMTSADDLFANTTLEQIITDKSIFRNCEKITSFNRTFENTNITSISANFFVNNTLATSFERTFAGCGRLSNIQSGEDIPFLFPGEDVEITSVKNMFLNCGSLVSEVPAFWKTFYGCSFADPKKNPQYTYKGCENIKNVENIPGTWGGYAATPDYQYTSEAISLKYIKLPRNKYGTFELTNIVLQNNYKYVIDVTIPSASPYEIVPLFGSGYLNDPKNETSISKVIDFNLFGSGNGTSLGTCTNYLTYRLGNNNLTTWDILASSTSTPYDVFKNLHGSRVTIDICYTEKERVIIKNKETGIEYKGVMNEYSTDGNIITTNTPTRLYSSYAVNVDYLDHLSVTADKYYCSASDYPIIHEVKIYDRNNVLLYDLLPYYAIISGVGTAIFKDVNHTTENIYVGTGEAINDLEYYKNNI